MTLTLVAHLSPDARHRLARLGQGPWPLLTEPAERGGALVLARAGGATGYRADVQEATWSLPDVPVEDVPTLASLWSSWPGRRGVVVVSGWTLDGQAHEAARGDLLRLAAVWAPGVQVGLVTRGGRPVDVREAQVWAWLHGERPAALAALGGTL